MNDSHHLRVLVVDDNVDAADTLATLVRLDGHDVEVAYDGPTPIEAARRSPPDVVFLDLGLPGTDGWQVATKLLSERATKKPFVVAVTGFGDNEHRKRSAEAGILVHFTKPANPETLLGLLRRFRSIVN